MINFFLDNFTNSTPATDLFFLSFLVIISIVSLYIVLKDNTKQRNSLLQKRLDFIISQIK